MQGGVLYLDEEAKIKWTRQLRGDADGDGKIDDDEYMDEIPIRKGSKYNSMSIVYTRRDNLTMVQCKLYSIQYIDIFGAKTPDEVFIIKIELYKGNMMKKPG